MSEVRELKERIRKLEAEIRDLERELKVPKICTICGGVCV